MGKHISNELRHSLIFQVFNKFKTIKEAAENLNVGYKAAVKVCRVFREENRLDKKVIVKARLYNQEMEEKILKYFHEKPDSTLSSCREYIRNNQENNERVPSIATIDRILKKRKISFKCLSTVPEQGNSVETIKLRKKYVIKFRRLEDTANFVYINEFGCNLSMRRGRSAVGAAATISTSDARGSNLSVCAAIDLTGPLHYYYKFGAFNQHEFITFLEQLSEKLDKNKRNLLVFDNAQFHKTLAVRECLKEKGLKQMFLPPWSPMLNPIEECFSKVKGIIRKELGEKRELFAAVDVAFSKVTKENCEKWFRHSKKFFEQCLKERPILKVENVSDSEFESEFSDGDELFDL